MWPSYTYSQFFSFIEKVDFDAIVDHLALTHIIKRNAEPVPE